MQTVWCAEAARDPFIALGIAAASTDRVQIGTGIAVAYGRSPYATAQAAWELQQLSGGRMHLGLATQVRAHIERRYGVAWPGGVSALREYVMCCRAIWHTWQTGLMTAFEGEHFRFLLSNPEFSPGPLPATHAEIPVWIAAVTRRSARLAGEIGDGLHVHAFHTAEYLRDVVLAEANQVRRARGEATPIQASCPVLAGVAHDDHEAAQLRRELRATIAFYASTRGYLDVLSDAGLGDLHEPLKLLARAGRWGDMPALIDDAVLDRFVLIDEPAALARRLRDRYEGLLSEITLYRTSDRFATDDDLSVLIKGIASPSDRTGATA